MQRKYLFYGAYAALGIIWGTNFLYMKWAAQLITPAQIVFLRVLCGFFPVLLLALYKRQLKLAHLKQAHHFLVMSLLATTVYFYCFAQGTALLDSGIAGALSGSIPLFSSIITILFLKEERVNLMKAAGVFIGFLGVVMIAKPWNQSALSLNLSGVMFMILGSFSVGASFVYAKKFIAKQNIPAIALTTYQMFFAVITILLLTDLSGTAAIQTDTKALMGVVLGLGVIGTGVAYVLYYVIVSNLGAVMASSVTYIPPVVALFIAFFIAKEAISSTDWLGMAIILLGVYVSRFAQN